MNKERVLTWVKSMLAALSGIGVHFDPAKATEIVTIFFLVYAALEVVKAEFFKKGQP